MKIFEIILNIVSFLFNLFPKRVYNSMSVKDKKEVIKDVSSKDPSDVTSGFDRINRLR
jgi:hypothetical protein